ncbi:MAG: ABC transporter substrate-binding protein [Myxococcota bacterium]
MKSWRFAAVGLLVLVGCKKNEPPSPVWPAPAPEWLAGRLPADVGEGVPKRGGVLVVRVPNEPAGLSLLHDQMAEGWMRRYTQGPLYETLAEMDRATHPRYDLKPLLAESWSESPDRLTLTVRLRRGVQFHNGALLTAGDLRAVMDAIMNPKNLTKSLASYFVDVAGYEVKDAYTFVLRWKKPYVLATRTFLTAVPLMPASALEGDFDGLPIHRAPIGTGPFQFVSWETNRSITYARFPRYWGPASPLDRIVIRLVKDHTVATQLWERGEFDLMTFIQPTVWRSIEAPGPKNAWAQKGYHRVMFFENNYSWLGWNEARPFFQDKQVRRALGMLYPAQKVAKNIDLQLEEPTTCPYYRDSDSCDRAVQPLPYDVSAARALLAQAGWKDSNGDGVLDQEGRPFRFTFLANPHSVRMNKLLPLLQEEYRQVGIEMDIEKVETAVFFSRLRAHDFDAASLSWSTTDRVQDNYQIFHSSQIEGGSNFVSYSNPEVDRTLEAIRTELDDARRAALERKVHRLLYEDQVYTFLTHRAALDAAKTHVRGLAPALNWYDLRKVWLAGPVGR